MNAFEKAIEDCFQVKEFQTYFTAADGRQILSITCRPLSVERMVTLFGVDAGWGYEFTCKAADFTPRKGDKIHYQGAAYKIDNPITRDSFGLTWNFTARSLSSK